MCWSKLKEMRFFSHKQLAVKPPQIFIMSYSLVFMLGHSLEVVAYD